MCYEREERRFWVNLEDNQNESFEISRYEPVEHYMIVLIKQNQTLFLDKKLSTNIW